MNCLPNARYPLYGDQMKKTLWTLTLVLWLTACAPAISPDQRASTQTAVIVSSNQRKTQTAEARPTFTPAPSSTPDLRSAFDKCAQSGIGVRYAVFGDKVGSISTTIENDTGGTEQHDYQLPLCKTYRGFETGDFLYVSAQIQTGTGKITCRIYQDDQLIAESSASGEFSIATCTGTVK